MTDIEAMMRRVAQPGRVAWIGLRPERLGAVAPVAAAEVTAAGLAGDHGRKGRRAVTLIQAEHLPALAGYLGREGVDPAILRRNIAVAGINLEVLKGRPVRIGRALVRLTVPCHPCSRMEAALGPGGHAAMRGHGGWCAEVMEPGRVALGDAVGPED